jgi:hypothetical protein
MNGVMSLDPRILWIILIIYVMLAALVALLSIRRRVDSMSLFFFGLILTPLVTFIVMLRSPRKPRKNVIKYGVTCDKCGYTYFDSRSKCSMCGTDLPPEK